MKVIKEGFKNLDSVMHNKNMEAVTEINPVMSDAYLQSELNDEQVKSVQKELEKNEKKLDESYESNSMSKKCEYIADELSVLLDMISSMDNQSDYFDNYDLEALGNAMDCLYDAVQMIGSSSFNESYQLESTSDIPKALKQAARDLYAVLDGIERVTGKKAIDCMNKDDYKKIDDAITVLMNPNISLDKDLTEGKYDRDDEWDDFTWVQEELSPTDNNSDKKVREKGKFKDIYRVDRYDIDQIGLDYDYNTIIYGHEDSDFDFAYKVADAYGLEISDKKVEDKDKNLYKVILKTSVLA